MSHKPVIVRRRQEHRRRPSGAAVLVAPGDAAQIDDVEQKRPDVDIPAGGGRGHLPDEHRLGRPGRTPDHGRLAGLDEEGEHLGELARAQRVVGGDGLGQASWARSGSGGDAARATSLRAPGPSPRKLLRPFPRRFAEHCGSRLLCRAREPPRRRRRAWIRRRLPSRPSRLRRRRPADKGMPVSFRKRNWRVGDSVWPMRRSSAA